MNPATGIKKKPLQPVSDFRARFQPDGDSPMAGARLLVGEGYTLVGRGRRSRGRSAGAGIAAGDHAGRHRGVSQRIDQNEAASGPVAAVRVAKDRLLRFDHHRADIVQAKIGPDSFSSVLILTR